VDGTEGRIFFFMHVMKTAGTSFVQHIGANFSDEEIYPRPSAPAAVRQEQYWKIAPIRRVQPEDRAAIRIFHGHFPYLVGAMVGADTTLTILREPVERTISHMRHCRKHFAAHRDKSLEEIYEDGWLHPLFFRNYQVKQFALTAEDDPKAHNEDIVVDGHRLRTGIENLERVDVLGLTDHFEDFVDEVVARFGWNLRPPRRLQVGSGSSDVPASLRSRIVEDNRLDLEFYERARTIHAERSRSGHRPGPVR
jgi:hypothetical protein